MPIRGDRLRWPPRPGKKHAAANAARRPPAGPEQQQDTQRPLAPPHERDESAPEQPSAPRPVIEQAFDDVQSGQQDTDCRNRSGQILDRSTKDRASKIRKPSTGDS